jgi:hypothetical protein
MLLGGQRKVYATILTLLFGATMINLAIYWQYVRDAMILNDDNSLTIQFAIYDFSKGLVIDVTAKIAIFLADIILVRHQCSQSDSDFNYDYAYRYGDATLCGRGEK